MSNKIDFPKSKSELKKVIAKIDKKFSELEEYLQFIHFVEDVYEDDQKTAQNFDSLLEKVYDGLNEAKNYYSKIEKLVDKS